MSHSNAEHREQRGARIGYTRVSTVLQTLDQQNEALAAANVIKTFSDIMSGARDDRPGLPGQGFLGASRRCQPISVRSPSCRC